MEKLNRLKDILMDLKHGMRINHGSAIALDEFRQGATIGATMALNSALTTSDVGFAASQAIEPASNATFTAIEPAFAMGSEMGRDAIIQSNIASTELDELGLIAPSIAVGVSGENPLLGSAISADIALNTDSEINTGTNGFVRMNLPPGRKLETLKLLSKGGKISRKKLLRKRRFSRNRK